jgi:hypothetical protein
MSKFDKLFTNPTTTASNNGSFGSGRPNSFLIKEKEAKSKANANFDYKEEAFPDLLSTNKPIITTATLTKKYSDITATVNEVQKVENNPVPPGWIQFTRTKGKSSFDVLHGDKTKRELEMDQEDALLDNPAYIYNKMIETLSNNWTRYKVQYDSIHGEGAYDLVYYSAPVYPEDEYYSDGISDNNNDYTGSYEYINKYSYDAEAQSE